MWSTFKFRVLRHPPRDRPHDEILAMLHAPTSKMLLEKRTAPFASRRCRGCRARGSEYFARAAKTVKRNDVGRAGRKRRLKY